MKLSILAGAVCGWIVLFTLLSGCSPRTNDETSSGEKRAETVTRKESVGQQASPPNSNAHPEVRSQYEMREVEAYEADRLVIADMIRRNPRVYDALSASKEVIDHSTVDRDDTEQIGKLVSSLDAFTLRGTSGDILRFGPTLVVVVPGAKGQRNVNAFLIRIPQGNWMLLGVREMP